MRMLVMRSSAQQCHPQICERRTRKQSMMPALQQILLDLVLITHCKIIGVALVDKYQAAAPFTRLNS
ncbi:hypothetical protein D3C86_1864130 [compost metagenome]